MTCDDAGILLEMRAHAALADADRPALDAHLAGCAACRALADLVTRVDGALGARARQALAEVDWRRLDRQLDHQRTVMRWFVPAFFVLMGATVTTLLALGRSDRAWLALPFGALWAGLTLAAWRIRGRWLRQWEPSAATGDELLGHYRRWLAERRKDARQGLVTCLVCAGGIPLLGLLHRPESAVEVVALVAAPVVLIPFALHTALVELPRLERERASLE